MARIEIISFSGYGHTLKQAESVQQGAATEGDARLWSIPDDGVMSDPFWEAADAADVLVFGSPTYMGAPAWQFKRFADESSKRWMTGAWLDKYAGGFTNSASPVGDKGDTINYFRTFAGQHGMLWVPLGQPPANLMASTRDDRNWAGGSGGAIAVSPVDASPEQGPSAGDLLSARDYGARLGQIAKRR